MKFVFASTQLDGNYTVYAKDASVAKHGLIQYCERLWKDSKQGANPDYNPLADALADARIDERLPAFYVPDNDNKFSLGFFQVYDDNDDLVFDNFEAIEFGEAES